MDRTGTILQRRRFLAAMVPDVPHEPSPTPPAKATIAAAIASGGFGKSVVLRELLVSAPGTAILIELTSTTTSSGLLDAIARESRRRGLSDLAWTVAASRSAAEPGDTIAAALATSITGGAIWLGIDEVQHLDDSASTLLSDLHRHLGPPGALLVAGRTLPGPLIRAVLDGTLFTSMDLAFTRDEIIGLLEIHGVVDAATEAESLLATTQGWPAAVDLGALRAEYDGIPVIGHDETPTASLLPAAAHVPGPVRALASLPVVNAEICAVVTGHPDLRAMRDAGIPAVHRQDGWWEIADPIRERLADPAALTDEHRRAIAAIYLDHGRLRHAFDTVSHDPAATADLLAGLSSQALESLGISGIDQVLARIDDATLAQRPEALAGAVRFSGRMPLAEERQRWLARAEDVIATSHLLRPFILAESARWALRRSDLDRAESLARQAIDHPACDENDRGRAELVLGLANAARYRTDTMRHAAEHLDVAIDLLHRVGDDDGEADARYTLAYGVDFTLGAIPAAADGLRAALDLLPIGAPRRADVLTYLAETLCWLPDLPGAQAAMREAESIAARLQDDRLTAYVQWSWAWIDTHRRDLPALQARVQTLLTMTDSYWYGLAAGAALHCDLTEMFAAVGDAESAFAHLQITEQRVAAEALTSVPLDAAWIAVHARFGDPASAGERIATLLDRADSAFVHPWRFHLLAAWCAHRSDDAESARQHAITAFASASATGHLAVVDAIEPEIATWARRLIGRPDAEIPFEISVFGQFAVRRGPMVVTPPPGAPRTLVAALAINGAQSAESLADLLWPDAEAEVGRSRLRNLLNRVRSASGGLIVRVGDRVSLHDSAGSDWSRWERALAAAEADPHRREAALTALHIANGDLLPGMEGEWIDLARTRVTRATLELRDRISRAAEQAGDLDFAIRSLEEAARLDPVDSQWSIRRAALLSRQGRRIAARNAIASALDHLADYDLEPGADILAMARKLGVQTQSPSSRRTSGDKTST